MQINKVNTNPPIQANAKHNNKNNKQNTSFKGAMPLDSFCLGVANLIENGGLAISFTLQDMLGTNLPRPIMGLRRNKKENNGATNFSFAAKEMVREFLTGPSMFLIPLGMLTGAKKAFGKASEVPAKFINAFGNIHANNAVKDGKVIGQQDFFKSTFEQIIKNAKGETEVSKATTEKAAEFAKTLADGIKSGKKDGLKQTITNLSDDFVNIAKSHATDAAHADFTVAQVAKGVASPFKTTVSHMVSYADDVVEKASTQAPEKAKEFIEKLADKKTTGRFGLNLLMYATVLTFLQVIPKLYNKAEGKKNAGLKGLMKEETLNDTSLNSKDNKKAAKKANDKSKPSFGSAADVAKKITGDGIVGKIANIAEYEGCNVSFPLLLGIMGGGIVLPRTIKAKDKYDREEILRRDLVTCAVMCFAEKELGKGFSKLNEARSGLVLAAKEKGFKDKSLPRRIFDYLRPINGVKVLSTEQIRSKYTDIDKYKDGVKGFCDFISGQGGNLGKVFGLTEESKSIVGGLLEREGKDLATADNKVITEVLDKAKGSEELKKLTDLFKNKDNAWVKKARTLNARFTALSVLVLVPLFLGFMLPAINERATKKRISNEQALEAAKNAANASNGAKKFDYMQDDKASEIFADMKKYTK